MNDQHYTFFRRFIAVLGLVGVRLTSAPVINEFMASNSTSLADDDGAYPDWIEIHNPDAISVDLNGWFLTDTTTNKAKWKIPGVIIPAGGYIIIFASNKDRRDPTRPLHTNFTLNAQGEYLGLVRPDETTVVSEYAPLFPPQQSDHSYGLIAGTNGGPAIQGFLGKPTPGAANSGAASVGLPQTVGYSRAAGVFSGSFDLQLNGAGSGQRIRYVVTPASSAGNAAEPTLTSPEYSGPIKIGSSVVVRAAVFSSGDASKGAITTTYYAKLASSVASFSSKLPILVIDTLGSGPLIKDAPDKPSWLTSFSPTPAGTSLLNQSTELTSALKVSVRGSSSVLFPKKSYNLEFTDSDGNDSKESLADLPAAQDWALVGGWKYDQTHINNAFVYALSNRMGRWAPQVRFTEVFLNTQGDDVEAADYAGIYALTDRVEVDNDRVDLKSLSRSDLGPTQITGGYILKIDAAGAEDVAWRTTRGTSGEYSVILSAPNAGAVAPEQIDYIRGYVQRMEDALYADQAGGWAQRTYLDYVDRASWVDHHILNTFAANPDAFVKSAYFNKDRSGKLCAGPVWDFDRALGSYWDERSYRWEVWSGVGAADVWKTGWWGVIATDPEFMQEWIDRWQSLRRSELSNSALTSLITSLSGQIGPEAAARDATRWPENQSSYGSYAAQIDHMKGWVTQRAQWIDDQFLRAPGAATANGSISFTAPSGAKLAYTLDGSDPRALGGAIAPNAIVADSPVVLPAGANIHIRSYRAELRGTFPGSPWSSAAAGDASTPLSPTSRIINLSSRAVIGSGPNALFAGVVVADTAAKPYLARAVGPGLAAFGAAGVVSDPELRIISGAGAELFRNTGWETGPDAARMAAYNKSVGAFALVASVK
ncbi:MAG: CotH kinase family protein, partial [Opitutaceae bacterium]